MWSVSIFEREKNKSILLENIFHFASAAKKHVKVYEKTIKNGRIKSVFEEVRNGPMCDAKIAQIRHKWPKSSKVVFHFRAQVQERCCMYNMATW